MTKGKDGQKLKLSINPRLVGKNEAGDTAPYAFGWQSVEKTAEELLALVSVDGVAYTAQLTGKRKAANFFASDVVSVDVDHGMTIEQALANPFIKKHALFIYTTASHTPQANRFRMAFRLARTITDAGEMRAIQRSLALRLFGDRAATDATRISFGNRGAQTWLINGVLDVELMAELIAQSMNDPAPNAGVGGVLVGMRSLLAIDPAMRIKLATGVVLPFSSIAPKTSCHCPFHADEHASAFVVKNQHGVNGLHCAACGSSYWPPNCTDDVDFRSFDRAVHAAQEHYLHNREIGPLGEFFGVPRGKTGLVGCNIEISDRQVAPAALSRGLTLIKSPKGSGKTQALTRLIAAHQKVLLIGHRRSLIRQSCARLGLSCYLDNRWWIDRAGICLDSLYLVRWGPRYDVVVLDESEQLLGHFLSDTMGARGADREALFAIFGHTLRRAKHVVALDADLGWITLDTLTRMMGPTLPDPAQGDLFDKKRPVVRMWLNEAKPGLGRTTQLYRSKMHLLADLMQSITAGKRVFVTANSKALVNDIASMIADQLPNVRRILLTADTLSGPTQKAFLENPQQRALDYDVILTSPAVGTGVDISFPDKQKLIDVVYGFAEANINTHFDFDQQLGRVRDPGAVRVWVNPRRFHFEVSLDAVRRELLERGLYKNLVIDYSGPGGTARYVEDDALIEMAALVLSQIRAAAERAAEAIQEDSGAQSPAELPKQDDAPDLLEAPDEDEPPELDDVVEELVRDNIEKRYRRP